MSKSICYSCILSDIIVNVLNTCKISNPNVIDSIVSCSSSYLSNIQIIQLALNRWSCNLTPFFFWLYKKGKLKCLVPFSKTVFYKLLMHIFWFISHWDIFISICFPSTFPPVYFPGSSVPKGSNICRSLFKHFKTYLLQQMIRRQHSVPCGDGITNTFSHIQPPFQMFHTESGKGKGSGRWRGKFESGEVKGRKRLRSKYFTTLPSCMYNLQSYWTE